MFIVGTKEEKVKRAHAYNTKGEIALKSRDYGSALDAFNSAIETLPWFSPDFCYKRGYTYLSIAETIDTFGAPETISRLSLALADFTTIIKHFEAIKHYQYSNLTSDDQTLITLCYLSTGQINRNLGKYDQALLDFNKILNFENIKYAYAKFEIGVTYYKNDNFDTALENFTDALNFKHVKDLSQSDIKLKAHIFSYQGHIYLRKDEIDIAINHYASAIKDDPSSLKYIAAEKDSLFDKLRGDKTEKGTQRLRDALIEGTTLYKIIMHQRKDTPCKLNQGVAKKISDELKLREKNNSERNNNTKKIRRTLYESKDKGKSIDPGPSKFSDENQTIKDQPQKIKKNLLNFMTKPDKRKSITLTLFNDKNDSEKITKIVPNINYKL